MSELLNIKKEDLDKLKPEELADLKVGSVLFFIADKKANNASKQAGMIRTELGKRLDLIDNDIEDILEAKYGDYKLLLDEYITPYLCWQVMTSIQIALDYKFTNSGMIDNYDERKNRLDYTHSKALSDQYQKYANAYATKLKNYLCANSNQYP